MTVTGNGSLTLAGNTTFDRVLGLQTDGSAVLINDVEHTIAGDGTIAVNLVNNGQLLGESPGSRLTVTGTLSGSGLVANVNINGTHQPGSSTAIVPIQEAYSILTTGRLKMELGGVLPGSDHDQLRSLDPDNVISISSQSRLEVTLTGGFLPADGQVFTLISTAGLMAGEFGTEDLPALGPTLGWELSYSPNSLEIRVVPFAGAPCDLNADARCDIRDLDALVMAVAEGGLNTLIDMTGDGVVDYADVAEWLTVSGERNLGPGRSYLPADANLDAVVDAGDFNIWNANKFSATGRWSRGDFNADGFTDAVDFNIWNARKFTSATAAVPEPSASACLILLALFVLRRVK